MLYGSILFILSQWILHRTLWLLGNPLPQTDTTASVSEMLGSFVGGGFTYYSPQVVSWGWEDGVWGSMSPPHSKNCTLETPTSVIPWTQVPLTRTLFGMSMSAAMLPHLSSCTSNSLNSPFIPEQSLGPCNLARLSLLSSLVNAARHW